jgi:hypothetical protein
VPRIAQERRLQYEMEFMAKVKRETQKNCAIWESKQTLSLQRGKFHGAITRATPRGSGTTIAVPGRAIGGTGT